MSKPLGARRQLHLVELDIEVIGCREIQSLTRDQDAGAAGDHLGIDGKRPVQCEPKRDATSRRHEQGEPRPGKRRLSCCVLRPGRPLEGAGKHGILLHPRVTGPPTAAKDAGFCSVSVGSKIGQIDGSWRAVLILREAPALQGIFIPRPAGGATVAPQSRPGLRPAVPGVG